MLVVYFVTRDELDAEADNHFLPCSLFSQMCVCYVYNVV